jgi:hypothetical protein
MPNNSTSPFSGLDKALLRSTNPSHQPVSKHNQAVEHPEITPPSVPISDPTTRPRDEETTRPRGVPTTRPPDRAAGDYELIRRGFEWYAYQLRKLKKLSLKEPIEGKPGSMSAMLRDALDDYLKKRASEL